MEARSRFVDLGRLDELGLFFFSVTLERKPRYCIATPYAYYGRTLILLEGAWVTAAKPRTHPTGIWRERKAFYFEYVGGGVLRGEEFARSFAKPFQSREG